MDTVDVTIRTPRPQEGPACESLLRDAFWDVYRPGCHEHLLWRLALQGHPDLVAELTLVAAAGVHLVGCMMSTRASVAQPDGIRVPVLALGPLGVLPGLQRRGIGTALMAHTLRLAREGGHRAAFLYGDPDYYSRFGFVEAARWQVTTPGGDNFPDFMGRELQPDGLAGVTGRLLESPLFEVDDEELERFELQFPPRQKGSRPRPA